jgi:hypothetical protein
MTLRSLIARLDKLAVPARQRSDLIRERDRIEAELAGRNDLSAVPDDHLQAYIDHSMALGDRVYEIDRQLETPQERRARLAERARLAALTDAELTAEMKLLFPGNDAYLDKLALERAR